MSEIPLYLYELMDRSAIILDEFIEYVQGLPPVEEDKELQEQAEKCVGVLMDMYQLAASKWYRATKDNPDIWKPRKELKDE